MIYSRQREIVLNTLTEMHGFHPSANDVYLRLHEEYPSISLATVYRNLGQLSELKTVKRIPLPEGADRYDDATEPHLHMLCTSCGHLCDMPLDILEELITRANDLSAYEIHDCDILFFGVCDACRKAKQ